MDAPRTCDVCDQVRYCVELLLGESTMAVNACHECRGFKSCHACSDVLAMEDNDRDFDAQGNPRRPDYA